MYAELLARTNYSFLRGASHPEEMVAQAAELGFQALGLADLDGVYGLAKAHWKAKDLSGFKLLCGAELSLEGAPPLVLHAKDKAGWSLLCRLITASHADKPKGEAGLPWERLLEMLQASPARSGLLCLPLDRDIFGGEPSAAAEADPYPALCDLFGDDLYLPLLRQMDGHDAARTARARQLRRRYGFQIVASDQPHYHAPGRRRLQDALTCIREGVALKEAGHRLFPNGERYLKPPAAMAALFSDLPEALSASLQAAERCSFRLDELRYRYPSEWIPQGQSAQGYLAQLSREGLREKYPRGATPELSARVEQELGLIGQLGFADYFLTIHEMMAFARGRGILCQGRGSAANSVVCYCLGITAVDPSKTVLLFERFLSVERKEPPDIDVDFEHERREEVIQHLYDKHGRDRAGMVSAVISYRDRSAIGDLSKALGAPVRVKRHQRESGLEDQDPRLVALAGELRGFPRHLSIHSGGFVLSAEPLVDLVPIEPGRMKGRTVVQWDKYDLDYIGLMKVDVLALGMLSALRRCLDMIGVKELDELPQEDARTYDMIGEADTVGVFQIESRAQMSMLGRLKPKDFYDLVIEVAIVRPGPIVGQMVHPYLRRRRGLETPHYEHEKLKEILGRTLGVPLFQEQVMKIAVDLGGFSPGQADELRRAIGAWRSDGRLGLITQRLRAGLRASGLSEAFCERLMDEIKGFAEYGFPESHAASFALLVYASSYLKCHHPAEFTASMINSQPMGFYANHTLVDDAKRHGVRVLPLDLNESAWDCTVVDKELRLGLRVAAGLSLTAAQRLMERRMEGRFESLEDFVRRAGLPLRVLQSLALGDAFAPWGWPQREALWRLLELQMLSSGGAKQGELFGFLQAAEASWGGFEGLSPWAAVQKDYEAYGLSTRAHPMQSLRGWAQEQGQALGWTAAQARAQAHGAKGWAAGLAIVRQHPGTAKGVVFVTLEDESGLLDLVLWKDVYERYRLGPLQAPFLRVWGELQRDGDALSFLVQRIQAIPVPREDEALDYRAHNWH